MAEISHDEMIQVCEEISRNLESASKLMRGETFTTITAYIDASKTTPNDATSDKFATIAINLAKVAPDIEGLMLKIQRLARKS